MKVIRFQYLARYFREYYYKDKSSFTYFAIKLPRNRREFYTHYYADETGTHYDMNLRQAKKMKYIRILK